MGLCIGWKVLRWEGNIGEDNSFSISFVFEDEISLDYVRFFIIISLKPMDDISISGNAFANNADGNHTYHSNIHENHKSCK